MLGNYCWLGWVLIVEVGRRMLWSLELRVFDGRSLLLPIALLAVLPSATGRLVGVSVLLPFDGASLVKYLWGLEGVVAFEAVADGDAGSVLGADGGVGVDAVFVLVPGEVVEVDGVAALEVDDDYAVAHLHFFAFVVADGIAGT